MIFLRSDCPVCFVLLSSFWFVVGESRSAVGQNAEAEQGIIVEGLGTLAIEAGEQSQELLNRPQDSKVWNSTASDLIESAINRSGENSHQLRRALAACPIPQREGLEFLIANMPDRDLRSLTSEFLLEEVRLAYLTWEKSPWKDNIPKEIFLNNVLPYSNINERRDAWRKDFNERFLPLIEGAKSPGLAAARLNQKLFSLVNVRYSTQRPKADQSPFESIKSSTASCTGLSVLLIDACRAVGIPARFVGTPLWSDNSGNHSWVEVWDNGWHFTGAAEPTGEELDKAWFIDRASKANLENAMNSIYAVSFQKTPIHFPLVWDRSIDYISAVNVTDRYIHFASKPPEGAALAMFRVLDRANGIRLEKTIRVFDTEAKLVFAGKSRDERFDANDHLSVYLPIGQKYHFEVGEGKDAKKGAFVSEQRSSPITETLDSSVTPTVSTNRSLESTDAVVALADFLRHPFEQRLPMNEQAFAKTPIAKCDVAEATRLLWVDHVERVRKSRADEMAARVITQDALKMPFTYEVFGEKPTTGRSMFISMHGGGGTTRKVNDQQWDNQKKLYRLEEGLYVVPRAPTDTWDLWHQSHIDPLFERLIENMIVFEDVDPNRVYILGYSAGGDGVYQLAPRMADRWAAAAMMAGHPNETSPLGLRNLPFTLHMGENDSAYNRNKTASDWKSKLDALQSKDSEGYNHLVKIHAGKGHWMDREDAIAIPWMAKWCRNPIPNRIVWKQDDVVEKRFYWLAIDPKEIRDRAEIVATRNENTIEIQTRDADRVTIRLNDELVDLDRSVSIRCAGEIVLDGIVPRTIGNIAATLSERGDPKAIYSAEVTVSIPQALP